MAIVGGSAVRPNSGYSTDLFERPLRRTLPLTLGSDLVIDFLQKIDDVYTDYAFGVTVTLEIDSTPAPVSASATITSHHALCVVQSDVVDDIDNDVLWRCVVSYPTSPTPIEIVPVNGVTVRADS